MKTFVFILLFPGLTKLRPGIGTATLNKSKESKYGLSCCKTGIGT